MQKYLEDSKIVLELETVLPAGSAGNYQLE